MDKELTTKIFMKMDDCSQAAEQLSKTILKFESAGDKLHKSISNITSIEKMIKSDESFRSLLKSTEHIKHMMDYFDDKLPVFNEKAALSKETLEKYKSELTITMDSVNDLVSEFENISGIVNSVREIHDLLERVKKLDVKSELLSLKTTVDNLYETQKKLTLDLFDSSYTLNKFSDSFQNQFSEFKDNIGHLNETIEGSTQSYYSLIGRMQESIDNGRLEVNENNEKSIKLIQGFIKEGQAEISERLQKEMSDKYNDILDQISILASNQIRLQEEVENKLLIIEALEEDKYISYKTELREAHAELYNKLISQICSYSNTVSGTDLEDGEKDSVTFHTIEELYVKNNFQFPFGVRKRNWTDDYYFLVTGLSEDDFADGHYMKSGKEYSRNTAKPRSNFAEFIMHQD